MPDKEGDTTIQAELSQEGYVNTDTGTWHRNGRCAGDALTRVEMAVGEAVSQGYDLCGNCAEQFEWVAQTTTTRDSEHRVAADGSGPGPESPDLGPRIGDIPGATEALDAVANGQNMTRLFMDARAFIQDGTAPDELPAGRSYKWPHPTAAVEDDLPRYRAALKTVLSELYDEEKGAYPDGALDSGSGGDLP